MSARRDLTGQKFGMLTALQFVEGGEGRTKWKFSCECGEITIKSSSDVLSGRSTSCGCFRRANATRLATSHGESKQTPEWIAWISMKTRCSTPSDTSYPNYGGRGITVCERWENSYENFLEDMGRRPSSVHSLDRKDTNGNYTPDNCKWSTRVEQNNNRRNNTILTFRGRSQTLTQWCSELHISPKTVRSRIVRSKWTVEKALTTLASI